MAFKSHLYRMPTLESPLDDHQAATEDLKLQLDIPPQSNGNSIVKQSSPRRTKSTSAASAYLRAKAPGRGMRSITPAGNVYHNSPKNRKTPIESLHRVRSQSVGRDRTQSSSVSSPRRGAFRVAGSYKVAMHQNGMTSAEQMEADTSRLSLPDPFEVEDSSPNTPTNNGSPNGSPNSDKRIRAKSPDSPAQATWLMLMDSKPVVKVKTYEEYRAQVRNLLRKYNRSKLKNLDSLMEKYAGNEKELIKKIKTKYEGPQIDEEAAEIVRELLRKYNPEKLKNIDNLMKKYIGKEKILIKKIRDKYEADLPEEEKVHIEGKLHAEQEEMPMPKEEKKGVKSALESKGDVEIMRIHAEPEEEDINAPNADTQSQVEEKIQKLQTIQSERLNQVEELQRMEAERERIRRKKEMLLLSVAKMRGLKTRAQSPTTSEMQGLMKQLQAEHQSQMEEAGRAEKEKERMNRRRDALLKTAATMNNLGVALKSPRALSPSLRPQSNWSLRSETETKLLQEEVRRLLLKYNPQKYRTADSLLQKYAGREAELVAKIRLKYEGREKSESTYDRKIRQLEVAQKQAIDKAKGLQFQLEEMKQKSEEYQLEKLRREEERAVHIHANHEKQRLAYEKAQRLEEERVGRIIASRNGYPEERALSRRSARSVGSLATHNSFGSRRLKRDPRVTPDDRNIDRYFQNGVRNVNGRSPRAASLDDNNIRRAVAPWDKGERSWKPSFKATAAGISDSNLQAPWKKKEIEHKPMKRYVPEPQHPEKKRSVKVFKDKMSARSEEIPAIRTRRAPVEPRQPRGPTKAFPTGGPPERKPMKKQIAHSNMTSHLGVSTGGLIVKSTGGGVSTKLRNPRTDQFRGSGHVAPLSATNTSRQPVEPAWWNDRGMAAALAGGRSVGPKKK